MEEIIERKRTKVINLCVKILIVIIAIVVAVIGIASVFVTAYFDATFDHAIEKTSFKYSFGLIEVIGTLLSFTAIYFLVNKIFKKIKPIFLLIPILLISIFVYIIWIWLLKLNPESDQGFLAAMASAFLSSNLEKDFMQVGQYLSIYPFQFGMTLVVACIFKFFPDNYMILQGINAVCSIINFIILYRMSKKMFQNEKVQKILVLLFIVFSVYWMFFNVHFYGNIIGLTLALISILFLMRYLESNKKYNLIFCGLFITCSIIIKSNYNIFLCGILLVLFINFAQKVKLKTIIKEALPLVILLVIYLLVNFGYNKILVKRILKVDLPSGMPKITYFYMGMAEPVKLSPGWYTADTVEMYEKSGYDNDKTTKMAIDSMKDRMQFFANNPKVFAEYYIEKLASTWLNPTFQTIWTSLPDVRVSWHEDYANYIVHHKKVIDMIDVNGKVYQLEENIFNIYQVVIFIFSSIGIWKEKKNIYLKNLILPIIFIGGFAFHIIWETKAIYVIQYYFVLLPYAAKGMNDIFEIIENKKKKRLKENNEK